MIRLPPQLPLDLGHEPSLTRDDFMVAPCNQVAVHWVDRWPDWPTHAMVLIGPPAAGKSHLARIWSARSAARFITLSDIENVLKAGVSPGPLVLDQADLLIGEKESETALFHLYNFTKEKRTHLLLTMRAAPFALKFTVPDLASRLRSVLTIAIEEPDDDLLFALLVKLFHDRQVDVSEDLIRYLVPRMHRSFAAARDLVDRADRAALSKKCPVTIPLMREILQEQETR